jgi:hypothetical protein
MLDFSQITGQLQAFVEERGRALPQLNAALDEAAARLRSAGPVWETTRERIANSHTSWLVADWYESPERTHAPSECPMPHTVVAADGSQIVADRHDIALCYVLNVGTIVLRYGAGERASLATRPVLALPDDDLLDPGEGEHAMILPRRLAMRRLLAEFDALADLIGMEPADRPTVALSDGTLILWPLETEQEDFRAAVVEVFTAHLEAARARSTPVVGYISQPQSRDVVNALRVHRCPFPRADCDKHCPNSGRPRPHYVAPDCAGTERVTDADLFTSLLQPGERSALFGSQSKILNHYPQAQNVRFFYLHTGSEVARIEIPAWVADDPTLLDRTHAICLDQARKGNGYPVALAEAHELAVIRAPERDAFFHLMERRFVGAHQLVAATQKAVSKRARRV